MDINAKHSARSRILLADPSPDIQKKAKEALQDHYDICLTSNGADTLEQINTFKPHLVLSCIKLPGISGTEILQQLRANPETCTLPFLLLSDLADENLRVEGLNAAVICIIKPFSNAELLARISAQLAIAALENKAIERERKLIEEVKKQLEQNIIVEHALQEANKRKDEFLATLAHELRNPLAPIRNALTAFKASDDPKRHNEALDLIDRQLQQMVRLIDDLLDASRITLSKIELKNEYLRLKEVIEDSLEICAPLVSDCGHKLTVSLPDEDIYLYADKVRISQIFGNLLNNAAKYTHKGGRIELSAKAQNDEVTISIKDNGIGIPQDKLRQIFEMFAQVDTSLERSKGGLGIGLTLAKSLIEMHGGKISASSDGIDKGSTFSVTLPTVQKPAASLENKPADITKLKDDLKVLVVDDNEASAKTMGWTMEALGCDVMLAHEGVVALKIAEDYKPDLILLDIGLPGMNGYEVCKAMRLIPALSSSIFIAQTGWGEEKHKKLSQEAGFNHHLVKPVDMEQLRKILHNQTAA